MFYQTEIKQLSGMATRYNNDKEKYRQFFNPQLIFKVKINEKQSLSDEGFRDELRRAGLTTISSAPDKRGYWVAFTDDEKFSVFKEKMRTRLSRDKASFIDAIEGIEEIPRKEKIGEQLVKNPLSDVETAYLDIEIWRMPDGELKQFLIGSEKLIVQNGGSVTDTLVTDNFCLRRILANKSLLDELLGMREIAHADRPPKIRIESMLDTRLAELESEGSPSEGAAEILVVDSGVNHHPLLENAIGIEIALATKDGKIADGKTEDDAGHGTTVAGIALYKDIEACIEKKTFKPEIRINSAKVMYRGDYGYAVFNEKELVEHQLRDAVVKVTEKRPNCKIINLSFGNTARKMFSGQRQYSLASQIDDLSSRHGLIFVVAAGNNHEDVSETENYPDFLLENTRRVKIVDPASAAHAITVGSIYNSQFAASSVLDMPSPFTRVGPGLRGMIKPELVDYGGGPGNEVVALNPMWVSEGRLFTLDKGTSLSAPAVAHQLAIIRNRYPRISNNMVKALLLSSARIPKERPGILANIDLYGVTKNAINLLNVYGYGKPNLERALSSEDNRVLLIHDGEIGKNKVHFFTINLPESFVREKGDRHIIVTLVFDPPVNRNRLDYLGLTMEAHLFKNKTMEEVRVAYSRTRVDETNGEVVPSTLRKYEITLSPGINSRKRGVHQQGIAKFVNKPQIDFSKPLVLAVVSQDKWIEDDTYVQPYAVIVSIEHSNVVDLYSQILTRNMIRARIRQLQPA